MAVILDEDVLGLQVAMVDSHGMAIADRIQDLEEDMLGEPIVANEPALFCDVGEKVAFGAELDHDKGTVRTVEDAMQGNHVRMLARLVVKRNFSSLDPPLPSIQAGLGKRLDGVGDVGQDIDSLVHDTKSSGS